MGISQAQEELPAFSADRPGYTTGTSIVPHHKFAWENGFGYESSPDGAHCLTIINTMVRYGLFENMELRLGTDFQMFNDGQAMEPTFAFFSTYHWDKDKTVREFQLAAFRESFG